MKFIIVILSLLAFSSISCAATLNGPNEQANGSCGVKANAALLADTAAKKNSDSNQPSGDAQGEYNNKY